MVLTRRHLRLGLYAGVAWVAVESVLFWLCVNAIGFFPTLLFLALKGVGGFFLFTANVRALLGQVALRQIHHGLSKLGGAGLAAIGAFLIFLPGFVTTLAGLALFSPSVRGGIVRWAKRERRGSARDEIISLDPAEWREVGPPKPIRKPRAPRVPKPPPPA